MPSRFSSAGASGSHCSHSVSHGFAQAEKALQAAGRRGEPVLWYGEIALELVLGEVTPEARQAFLARVFRGVPETALPRWVEVLRVYYAHDGALQQAADALFMHKNTLGGRLDRLQALTGLNPRSRADGMLFQLAVEFLSRP